MKRYFVFLFLFILIVSPHNIFSTGKDDLYKPFAEVMPLPIGGIESIYKKIVYPEAAKKAGVEGKVYLLIYINENGDVDDVKILKGLFGGCDEAAVEAVKNSKFTPAEDKGIPIKVKLTLQIIFKLNES